MGELDYSDTPIGRIWMSTRTLLQMLQDRGFSVDWERDTPAFVDMEAQLRSLDLADSERSQRLLNQLRRTVIHPKTNEVIEVFWVCGKVGKNSDVVKDISGALQQSERGVRTTALVVQVDQCSISGPARDELDKFDDTYLEFFTVEGPTNSLLRNITHHHYQPQFKLLTESETQLKLEAYCATKEQIPGMLWEDPIRCYFGLKVGQMVRIKRLSDNGHDIAYRIVQPKQVGKKKK